MRRALDHNVIEQMTEGGGDRDFQPVRHVLDTRPQETLDVKRVRVGQKPGNRGGVSLRGRANGGQGISLGAPARDFGFASHDVGGGRFQRRPRGLDLFRRGGPCIACTSRARLGVLEIVAGGLDALFLTAQRLLCIGETRPSLFGILSRLVLTG